VLLFYRILGYSFFLHFTLNKKVIDIDDDEKSMEE